MAKSPLVMGFFKVRVQRFNTYQLLPTLTFFDDFQVRGKCSGKCW
nr:MAG TPA: hypothetical protein [Caudoviricetes sp.]